MADATTAEKIKAAHAPSWKKVLIWVVVALALLTGLVILLVVLFRKKDPVSASLDVVNYAKEQIALADLDAKIATAKGEAAEEAMIKQLEQIRTLPDPDERAKRLAELF